jgi:hypothetical protein
LEEVTMKRNAILLIMLSIMAIWLSGCITSHSPSEQTVTIKVGDSLKFSVQGIANGPYTWTKNGVTVGDASASFTYAAVLADLGTFSLKVSTKDSFNVTSTYIWTVEVVNDLPPVANAGIDKNLFFPNPVQLDGSASADPEGEPLKYVWEIVGRPAGSSCSLDDPTAQKPIFVPDKQGAYTIILIVSDGRLTSESDSVVINSYTDYAPPTADAGADQSALFPGVAVTLDGTASTDPEATPLTYMWKIDSGPAGSTAAFDDPTLAKPTFTPDKKGVYVCSLVVNNSVFDSGIDYVTIVVLNTAPVARAGDNVTIANLGGSTTLDNLSYDPDGQDLTYDWAVISRPYGSTADVSDAAAENPSFTPDKKGAYIIQITVSDGDFTNSDTVVVTCSNQTPAANAGVAININFGQTAQLNGSASDPDSDPLTYAWTVVSRPAGSTAELSNAAILNPTFTPDVQGSYQFALVATDNSGLSSAPSTVAVSTNNHQPVANAGDDVIMEANTSAVLDGSGSDIDSDPLTYTWRVISAPMGSGGDSTISDVNAAKPSFSPDIRGDYVIGLIVNDGQLNSVEDTMKVHVLNNLPVANAGPSQSLHSAYGTLLTFSLDGSASHDPDGDSLTYKWRIISKPAGSSAYLSSLTTVNPTLTCNMTGAYVVGLIVSDGAIDSSEATVTLTYANAVPVANAGTNFSQHTSYGTPNVFNLDGSGSSDGDSDALSYTWTLKSWPSGSTAALSDRYISNPTITADKIGSYVIGLVVSDGFVVSSESTITITYTNAAPTAVAGTYANVLYANRGNVALDGGGSSDGDSDTLTYAWTMTAKPSGSTAVLNSPTSQTPWFAMDLPGTYTISLTVSDGFVTSTASTTNILNSSATITEGFEYGGGLGAWFKNTGSTTTGASATAVTSSTVAPHGGTYSMSISGTSGSSSSRWYEQDLAINAYLISTTVYARSSSTSSFAAALYLDNVIQGANFTLSTSAWQTNARTGINKYVTNLGIRATWTTSSSRSLYTDDVTYVIWN